ncbi:hypothetical protein ZOSMA_58G00610 [Zostera marina]|uniref:Cytochrome P450 n=1 Tax=Zostera marina TaxID=29655 RepID=A0A0K9NXG8_ZOSMR|nr:hypothetical protein ZOSMA_58G00610 [Zostera marina]
MKFWSAEFVGLLLLVGCVGTVILRTVEWLWWKPKKLEKLLQSQGIKGTPYTILFGDLRKLVKQTKEAVSRPIAPFSNDILRRASPFFSQVVEDYGGKLCYLWLGTSPIVIVTDPKLVREIMCDKSGHIGKTPSHPLGGYLLNGLVNLQGQKWVDRRKIINPVFHVDKLKKMYGAFSCCCSELIDRWEQLLGSGESVELDVWPELGNLTGDIISRSAFGSSYLEGRRIFQLQTEQAELFIQAVRSIYIPGFKFVPTRNNRRRKEIDSEVCDLLRGIIKKREQLIATNPASTSSSASHDDLLGFLMDSNSNQETTGITTDEMIEECKLFYFAGQETTSVLLNWTLVVLSMYPNWQHLARQEVLQVCGRKQPVFSDMNQLKIVTMIIYEVLRLYSPALFLPRMAHHAMNIGGYSFPSGMEFRLPILIMHHDPSLWGDDVKEFKPERFSQGISKATKNKMIFFPFGAGSRTCIGQTFAMIEAKLGLAMILQRFKFELSPSYLHAPFSVLTLHPQHGTPLILSRFDE